EAPEKYRCVTSGCGKLFKAEQWVQKHIENKHAEELTQATQPSQDQQRYINYLADCDRILPTSLFPVGDYLPVIPSEHVTVSQPAPEPVVPSAGYKDLDQPADDSVRNDVDFDQALAAFEGLL